MRLSFSVLLTPVPASMLRAWVVLPALLIPAAIASAQNYKVETYRLFEVSGDVKAFSCGGGCCEGHDSTACVGVQVLRKNEFLDYYMPTRTVVYDNTSCCDAQCADRQGCGIYGKDGPANSCPGNSSRFTAAIGGGTSPAGNLGLCVAPGEVFEVPKLIAELGNLVNNSWNSGSNCSAANPFVPYYQYGGETSGSSTATWGGFADVCPNPVNPDIVCVPSDCTPGGVDNSPAARYGVEIIAPYGNEYFTRWDIPGIYLRWRATTPERLDSYRVVVYGEEGLFLDRRVDCETVECHYAAEFPVEAASYYWWVQPVSSTVTGEPSRAGVFNLYPPLPSCASVGGSCVYPTQPYAPAVCPDGATFLYGGLDCPDTCCGVDCSTDASHDHNGACGASDSCGHVFGTPADPDCGITEAPDTASCGELGGDHCSPGLSCPSGFTSLGTTRRNGTLECMTCCHQTIGDGYCEPGIEDCGTSPSDCPCWMPGTVCNASGSPGQCVDRCSDPAYHDHSGSCGAADECGHVFGDPRDCLPSCGAMGGDACSQSPGWCPDGHDDLGQSNDCKACCRLNPCASPNTHDHAGSCGSTDSCGHSFGANEDCGCPGAPPECDGGHEEPPDPPREERERDPDQEFREP